MEGPKGNDSKILIYDRKFVDTEWTYIETLNKSGVLKGIRLKHRIIPMNESALIPGTKD